MELISVIMLSFAICFITLIIGLVFFNSIILMSEEDKSKVLDKQRKSYGLTKERVERISLNTEQAYLDKYPPQGTKQVTFVAEKSKDLGLAAKVLSDKPKTKVLTREYDSPNKQDSQKLFDAGKMSPIVAVKFNTAPPNKSITCASNETPPNHKTRVALRKKRKSKQ